MGVQQGAGLAVGQPSDIGVRTHVTRVDNLAHQSMGRPGSALDNAVVEAFHPTLEFELRATEQFTTTAAARTRIAAWIDDYNTVRRHSTIGMISPINYELAQPASPSPHAA